MLIEAAEVEGDDGWVKMEGYCAEASNVGQRGPFPSSFPSFPVISGCHPFRVMTQRRQVTRAHDCHHDEALLMHAPILFALNSSTKRL
jgi:hypothetical protein